jgi:hypothetical protein
MQTHIKVVALLNIILGALGALAGVGVLLGGTFGSLMSGSFVGAIVGSAVSALVGIVIAALSLVGLFAGFGLLNNKPWARYVIIVLSVLRLVRFPFMTIFGAYSLWVLFNSETQRNFAEPVV